MDTSGIEPDPSRKFSSEMLSERDNQLHHVPLFFSLWSAVMSRGAVTTMVSTVSAAAHSGTL